MCKAMEIYTQRQETLRLIDYLTRKGMSQEEIISEHTSMYGLTEEYIRSLMDA